MSVLTDLIYGGSNAVAGLTEGAVNDAIAKYGADKPVVMPGTAYFLPTIYAATGAAGVVHDCVFKGNHMNIVLEDGWEKSLFSCVGNKE